MEKKINPCKNVSVQNCLLVQKCLCAKVFLWNFIFVQFVPSGKSIYVQFYALMKFCLLVQFCTLVQIRQLPVNSGKTCLFQHFFLLLIYCCNLVTGYTQCIVNFSFLLINVWQSPCFALVLQSSTNIGSINNWLWMYCSIFM